MLSEILNYIKKNKEASASEIAVTLKLERSMVESALGELVRKGRVEKSLIKQASCGGYGCGCSSSSCEDTVVFRHINSSGNGQKELAS